jgi:hypothetical protein
MKNYKLIVIGLFAALAGFTVQGCFVPQPPGECTVQAGQQILGSSNYTAQLIPKTPEAANCPKLDHLEIGAARFPAADGKGYTVAIRQSRMVDIYNGKVFSAAIPDGTDNDCTKAAKCETCVLPADGGGFTVGGVMVTVTDAGATIPSKDGGVVKIDVKNFCDVPQPDEVPRADDADPKGLNIISNAPFGTQFADKGGVCKLGTFTGGVQNLPAQEVVGGPSLPAIKVQSEWSNFEILNTSKVPATLWTATLKYTEGSCTNEYDVTAWWPIVHCEKLDAMGDPEVDAMGNQIPDETRCDPNPDLDAGRTNGSGMSPYFKPVCKITGRDDTGKANFLVCAPNVSKAELQ